MPLQHARALRREGNAADLVPITAHVDAHVARTSNGDYVQTMKLAGASFESADDQDIDNWHERLNILWRNVASPNLALWVHVVRRRLALPNAADAPNGFAGDLARRYQDRIANEMLMVNEVYLSLVYRPQPNTTGTAAMAVLRRTDRDSVLQELADSLDECGKKRQELLNALLRYDPEPLGVYRGAGQRLHSSLLEFHAFLVNGEWQPMPLPRSPLNEVVATTRCLFGTEAMEYRMPTQTRLGAFLGIKEYPASTAPGLFNALLTTPFPFVLTQSFTFLPKATALDMMKRQVRRMSASGDLAVSQGEELRDALDDLSSNRFVVGDHHFTLQVQTQPFDADAEPAARIKALNDHVACARALLADTGMVVAREDLALEAAFWAQLPANFRYRPRKSPITSRNFAGMAPFHNHPSGRATGNHWGDALATLVTTARSPYFFSLHASDPRAADGGSRKDVGHIAGIGPVGTGKTTLLGFLITLLIRFGVTQVVFDKDEGLHILIRALDGRYLPLKNGRPTGCNPLQLPPTADNLQFLKQWLRRLVRRSPTDVLSARHEEELDLALHGTLALDAGARRLSRVLEFLDPTDPEGPHARLRPWCAKADGDEAWVFDNPVDQIVPVLEGTPIVGFDVTDFLDNPAVRDPLTMYLFHLVRRIADGRRMVVWADEFARLLADPSFAEFAKNGLETWRKKDACLAAFTQSASHVLESDIARAIVEQTPTKIFFPNPDADEAEYTEGFNLTQREFLLVKQELEPGSRCFLVKQNHVSVVARLDLQGFDFELDVISGRTANVRLMQQLIETHGSRAADWLPRFQDELAKRRQPPSRAHPTAQEANHVA